MNPTVTEIVRGALLLLGVKPSESAITPEEAEDGLNSLNEMMNEWNVNGLDVGYETLDAVTDRLYVELGSIGAIKANLAVYIAPEYDREVSASLDRRARRSKNALRGSIVLNPSQFPDSLPVGSGNEDNYTQVNGDKNANLRDSRFYPANRRCR
jgi:hypothetical protein